MSEMFIVGFILLGMANTWLAQEKMTGFSTFCAITYLVLAVACFAIAAL